MDKVKAFLAKPGSLRLVSVLYWCALVAAKALGLSTVVAALGFLAAWIPALPISPDEAVGVVLSAAAIVKMLVRTAKAKPAPPAAAAK